MFFFFKRNNYPLWHRLPSKQRSTAFPIVENQTYYFASKANERLHIPFISWAWVWCGRCHKSSKITCEKFGGSFWHFWSRVLWNHGQSPPRNSSAQHNSQSSHNVPVWPLISTDDGKCCREDRPPWFLIDPTQEVKSLFMASYCTVDDRLLCIWLWLHLPLSYNFNTSHHCRGRRPAFLL